MSKKRLCVIDSCDYCPFLEKLEIVEKTKNNFLIDADFYKCNKTKLCVEAHNIHIKQPKEVLFEFCPLPSNNGWESEPNTDFVTRSNEGIK